MALIDDPALQARILREFRILGNLAPFELSELAVPVVDIGKLSDLDVQQVVTPGQTSSVRIGILNSFTAVPGCQPQMDDGDWVESGIVNNPATGTVLADTGALNAGLAMIWGGASGDGTLHLEWQWRNSANSGTLDQFTDVITVGGPCRFGPITIAVGSNERVRCQAQNNATGDFAVWLMSTNFSAAIAA